MRYNTHVVNLLPIKNQRTVAWEHRRRVLLVALLFGIFSFVLLGLFLLPSWMVVWSAVGDFEDQLASTKILVDLQRRQSGATELTDLQTRSDLLQGVLSQKTLTSILQDIMPRIPSGVSIQQISYSAQEKEIVVTLKGLAGTRATLTTLGDALRSSPLFSRVDVPVSSLARSTDIDFVVTLSLDVTGEVVEYAESSTTTVATSSVRVVLPEMSTSTASTTQSAQSFATTSETGSTTP